MTAQPRLVMYGATLRSLPLAARFLAAREAGCEALSLMPHDILQHEREGGSLREIAEWAKEAGIAVTRLEPFLRWVPVWEPAGATTQRLEALGCSEEDVFRIAPALDVRSLTLAALCPKDAMSFDEMRDCLAAFCARAATRGLYCDLEFMPFSAIPDLGAAQRLQEAVGAAQCGIMFDLWHYVRSGGVPDLASMLRQVSIGGIQLCDGARDAAPGIDPLTETVTRRVLPPDGEFPVTPIMQTLAEANAVSEMGLEVLSTALDELPPGDLIERCRRSLEGICSALKNVTPAMR